MVDFLSKLLNKDFVEKPTVTPVQKGNKSINVVSEPIPDIDYTLDAKQRKLFNLIENTQQNIQAVNKKVEVKVEKNNQLCFVL